jgi:hypothetical protein
MTFFGMALLTAIGTVVLAAFAVVTAVYARKAFREQSREVAAIEQQVKDEQEVTRQQAELLKVQTGQLEVLRAQLEDQRKASVAQAEVLGLQATELRESLEERRREAEDRHRAQASGVTAWFALDRNPVSNSAFWRALIRNASTDPVFDVRVFFHRLQRETGGKWVLTDAGGPPPDQTAPVLPPAAERRVDVPANVRAMFGDDPVTDLSCVVSIEFTDAAGNRWERDPRGALNPRS